MVNQTSYETEIVFPNHPYDAARLYYGVMAYPEAGAGLEGAPGSRFTAALHDHMIWSVRKFRGLNAVRSSLSNPTYLGPKRRDFESTLERGLRRVDRVVAAYDFYGSQLLTTFFAARELGSRALRDGRPEDAFHINPNGGPSPIRENLWRKVTPSASKLLRGSGEYWPERFGLNRTGKAADAKQKAKDIQRRAIQPSLPVLHMAHALAESANNVGPQLVSWGKRDPFLALLMNAELWIWDAIHTAERWRMAPRLPGELVPPADKMIKLSRSETSSDDPRGRQPRF